MAIQVVNKFKHTPTEFDVYVGRGSGLGNPYYFKPSKFKDVIQVKARDTACDLYEQALTKHMGNPESSTYKLVCKLARDYVSNDRLNLVCFCKPQRCHADSIKQAIYKLVKDGL